MANLLTNVQRARLVDIDVIDRLREDLGDITELAESIRDNGLMQPIVLEHIESNGKPYRLLAGGRRYTAYSKLFAGEIDGAEPAAYEFIPYVLVSELSPTQRIKLEVEENVRRKAMSWQELVRSIEAYHKASRRDARAEGSNWTQSMTGHALGMSQAAVSSALDVASALRDAKHGPRLRECETMSDAVKLLLQAAEDAANADLMSRIQSRQQASAAAAPAIKIAQPTIVPATQPGGALAVPAVPSFSLDQIAAFYRVGDCLDLLPKMKGEGVQHIICDPPYGIDMSSVSNSERVADTHVVADNLQLLPEFIRLAYDVIAEDGFMCMWYDLDHHEKIAQWAAKVGWRVCRWPIVWCKTSTCLNQAAQYNVTKATEVCYVFRRSERSIIKQKQATNYVLAPSAASSSHPFCKPAAVWNYLLQAFTSPGQVVLDPFAGQGSLLAAAFNAGRIPLGIEVDEKHVNSGLTYIQSLINAKPLAVGEGSNPNDITGMLDVPAF